MPARTVAAVMARGEWKVAGWLLPALALLLGSVVPIRPEAPVGPAPDRAAAVALRDTTADETRTVPAYRDPGDPARTVRLFSLRFYAHAGERRWVSALVVARQPRSTPDALLMAAVSVTCSPSPDGVVSASATQNLLRGSTTSFTPRFVYGVPRTGMVGCVVNATGLRPRPSYTGYRSANVWVVDAGSYLAVSNPVPGWSRSVNTRARSRVLDPGERWTPIHRTMRVGPVARVRIASDHKVTTCAAVGGSRDGTTVGRELCAGRVSRRGSTVRLVVRAVQLTARGRPCTPSQVVARRVAWVRPDVHHRMLYAGGDVRVSRAAGCVPSFAVFGTLTQVRGADVVVHAGSELTSVVPG